MTAKKSGAVFILLCLFIFIAILISCGKKDGGSDSKTADTLNTSNSNISNGTENGGAGSDGGNMAESGGRISAGLPDADYGGYKFRILSRGPKYNQHWYARDIYAENETGDPINDAVYQRNRTVENKYNISIVNIPENSNP